MPERAMRHNQLNDHFTLRTMLQSDWLQLLKIQRETYEHPRGEKTKELMRLRNCVAWVAVHHMRVVGYAICQFTHEHIEIVELAVSPEYRRRGFGRAMVHAIKCRVMSNKRRNAVVAVVDVSNPDGARFLCSLGFTSRCAPNDADAVECWWEKRGTAVRNRIKEYLA